ncbi:unnamed protein product [Prunus armeniaca]|uniref:3'-5' exonuclease domain-containing protein n=1 Tax=Prunus armeniaca TaxID=36596 RepID=A0A6J5VB46_PRUAR|nr:unnamed protein product [Prunus armeniaca]
MGLEERIDTRSKQGKFNQTSTICKHAFSDLTHISPLVFIYLLKACYFNGTYKATKKFRVLQDQVHLVLRNDPQPGPATFVIQCLYVLPIFDLYSEGFSHLIISALRRFLKMETSMWDSLEAKDLASQLFIDIVGGSVNHDERIVEKILEAFDIHLANIDKVMCLSAKNDCRFDTAKKFVEQYIFGLIESQSYMTAVTLLEHFSIRQSGQSFLLSMIERKQLKAADKWATFMGEPMLCVLVQEYFDRNMLKNAYEIIQKNNLRHEFPNVYHKYKESSLKKLAEKGCWDVAEARTNSNRQLLEYLVYLAMEAGYSEKVENFAIDTRLKLVVEGVVWVDEVNALHNATSHIEGCKVVGLDCEWKPNYVKGSKPNKLFNDIPDVLDDSLTRILQSPRILKLGYNFQCDMKQLAHSYEELECFKHYEMLLDIQNVFKEPRGGLSGLAKKILGVGLNKTRRNSNWEQRPLTQNQLEYAALDAAVLIHIFRHVRGHSQTAEGEGHGQLEWKSCIVSHMDNIKKSKKGSKKESSEAETKEDRQFS